MGKRSASAWTLFLIITLAAGPFFCYFGYQPAVKAIIALKSMGFSGVILFSSFFLFGTIIFFPLTLLAFASGVLYGLGGGFMISWIVSTAGACLAFLASRYVCREWIHHKVSQHGSFQSFREEVASHDWKITLLSRLSLFLPFTATNYAFGLTEISFLRYFAVSFLGLIPSLLFYVYFGTVSGSIVAYFIGQKNFTTLETAAMAFAGLASVVLMVYVFLMVRNLRAFQPRGRLPGASAS